MRVDYMIMAGDRIPLEEAMKEALQLVEKGYVVEIVDEDWNTIQTLFKEQK